MKVLARMLCAGMLISIIAGCASSSSYAPSLPTYAKAQYLNYLDMPGSKVFVVAVDPSGDCAVGFDYGKLTKEDAYDAAYAMCMEDCEKYGVLTKPVVYDINGTVVYAAAIKQSQAKD